MISQGTGPCFRALGSPGTSSWLLGPQAPSRLNRWGLCSAPRVPWGQGPGSGLWAPSGQGHVFRTVSSLSRRLYKCYCFSFKWEEYARYTFTNSIPQSEVIIFSGFYLCIYGYTYNFENQLRDNSTHTVLGLSFPHMSSSLFMAAWYLLDYIIYHSVIDAAWFPSSCYGKQCLCEL